MDLENIGRMAWNTHRDLGNLADEIESAARQESEEDDDDEDEADGQDVMDTLFDHETLAGQAYACAQRAREYIDALTDLTKDEAPMTPEQWARLNRAG